ncbi:MAG: hypothetical protein NUV60_02220 [Patescibacteria group bacterium]|nr:hypothetical protein [Patescibacteria group bacterium]
MSLLRLAFWTIILFFALSFFGISIQAIINSPAGQANLSYMINLFSQFWQWMASWLNLLS